MVNCVKCGKKIGWLVEAESPEKREIEFCKQLGVDVPTPICYTCYNPFREKAWEVKNRKTGEKKAEKEALIASISSFPVYTLQSIPDIPYVPIGVVSAHIALGTGPLSQILSSWTDLFGAQSETYSNKMIEAENFCLAKLKLRAHEMGADAVLGMQATFTELTKGNGMLLVCMTGTAVKINKEREL